MLRNSTLGKKSGEREIETRREIEKLKKTEMKLKERKREKGKGNFCELSIADYLSGSSRKNTVKYRIKE